MQVNPKKVVVNKAKRKGRGYGSGKGGHVVGFGQKGQGSRGKGKIKPTLEGGNIPLHRKLPNQPGNKSIKMKPATVTVSWLGKRTQADQVVDKSFLISEKVIKNPSDPAKIVGKDKLPHKITVKGIPVSTGAREAIEKTGGVVID